MTTFPIFFDGSASMAELDAILGAAGYHLRCDDKGRMVASRIPQFLRKSAVQEPGNVVRVERGRRVAK